MGEGTMFTHACLDSGCCWLFLFWKYYIIFGTNEHKCWLFLFILIFQIFGTNENKCWLFFLFFLSVRMVTADWLKTLISLHLKGLCAQRSCTQYLVIFCTQIKCRYLQGPFVIWYTYCTTHRDKNKFTPLLPRPQHPQSPPTKRNKAQQ
jgi:hypothetical protein